LAFFSYFRPRILVVEFVTCRQSRLWPRRPAYKVSIIFNGRLF
jgi:hypothetical protein